MKQLILPALLTVGLLSVAAALANDVAVDTNSVAVSGETNLNAQSIVIDPSKVQSLVDAPKGLMREHPYIAHFRKGSMDLYFVSAHHEHYVGCETFEVIRRAFKKFPIKRVIVEGRDYADGEISKESTDVCIRESNNGFLKWGESGYALAQAAQMGITSIGGEPTQKEQAQAALKANFTTDDILGHLFVCMIPSFRAQSRIERDGLPALFAETMKWGRPRVGLDEERSFDYRAFLSWYREKCGGDFNPQKIDYGLVASNPNGTFLQRLSEAKVLVRDRFLAEIIGAELCRYKQVLVVYGSGHYAVQRAAIEAAMGAPVYEGSL
jgi:hypothetical protein